MFRSVLAILGVIVSFISTSTPITPLSVIAVISTFLALWLTLTVFAAFILPKIINFISKGKEGVVEAAATASCFGASAWAALLGEKGKVRMETQNRKIKIEKQATTL